MKNVDFDVGNLKSISRVPTAAILLSNNFVRFLSGFGWFLSYFRGFCWKWIYLSRMVCIFLVVDRQWWCENVLLSFQHLLVQTILFFNKSAENITTVHFSTGDQQLIPNNFRLSQTNTRSQTSSSLELCCRLRFCSLLARELSLLFVHLSLFEETDLVSAKVETLPLGDGVVGQFQASSKSVH